MALVEATKSNALVAIDTLSDILSVRVGDVYDSLDALNAYIQGLPETDFKEKAYQRKRTIDELILSIRKMIAAEEYGEAIETLMEAIYGKADDDLTGEKNDWFVEDSRTEIREALDDILAYITYLMTLT